MSKSVPPIPRLEGEPTGWYSRLVSFCLMGPGRSALRLYNDERSGKAGKGASRSLPGGWQAAVTRWNWRERAELFDSASIELEREEMTRLRERERKKRLFLLIEARKKLQAIIQTLNPAAASWNAVASLLRAIGEESRSELELAELARQVADLERTAPDESAYVDRFRDEMRRLAGGRDADAA